MIDPVSIIAVFSCKILLGTCYELHFQFRPVAVHHFRITSGSKQRERHVQSVGGEALYETFWSSGYTAPLLPFNLLLLCMVDVLKYVGTYLHTVHSLGLLCYLHTLKGGDRIEVHYYVHYR